MARSSYADLGDACATAHGMELIGNRWTYPILRELMLGPKRFNELLATVRGITPAVLSARLRELTGAGLVATGPSSPSGTRPPEYALTAWALELRPILQEVGRWAQTSPRRSPGGGLTPDAAVQAMVTMAQPQPTTRRGELHLVLHDSRVSAVDHPYRVRWDTKGVTVERGGLPAPATTVRCDSSVWGQILFTGLPVQGYATVTGDAAPLATLLGCFPDAAPGRGQSVAGRVGAP